MKPLGVVSTAVLFLLLGSPASICAAQEKQDEAKPAQQEEPKPEKREEKRSQQEQPKQQEEKRSPQEQPKQGDKHAQHQEQPGSKAPMAAKRGARIPQDKFRAHFGREHTFVINRTVIVEGAPRFQVSGFWFEFIDPWPVGWLYTDPCYIDFIDDTYFLFDPLHPGIRIAIFVVG
jgi:hemolysin activation/secretion protein